MSAPAEPPALVRVSFPPARPLAIHATGGLPAEPGQPVVAETPRGLELGEVVGPWEGPDPGPPGTSPRPLLRLATEQDLAAWHRRRLEAAQALRLVRDRALAHGLPMQVLEARYTLDGGRIVLDFAAEGRVDFRTLARDLYSLLRCRVELHQVGPRDRAALAGGLGPCGRECCCSSWTREFTPVSIKMAKEQGLSLNPGRISGSCGRLMCCLRYEYLAYRDLRREMPAPGDTVRLPEGRVTVLAVHLGRATFTVEHPQLGVFEVPAGRARELEEAALCASCTSPKASRCEPGTEGEGDPASPPEG